MTGAWPRVGNAHMAPQKEYDGRVPVERAEPDVIKGVAGVGDLEAPKPLKPPLAEDHPVNFAGCMETGPPVGQSNSRDSFSVDSDDEPEVGAHGLEEKPNPRPMRSLKDLGLEEPGEMMTRKGSIESSQSKRASTSSNASSGRRLSGIVENSCVNWRLHFRIVGQNAWRITELLVTGAYQMFPLGAEPAATPSGSMSVQKSLSVGSSHSSSFSGKRSRSSNKARGSVRSVIGTPSPYSCHLHLDQLGMSENDGCASSHSSESKADEQIKGALKCSLLPVEMFSEDMPAYDSVELFKQSCTIFLVDPRQENIDEAVSDLMRRGREVENRVEHCLMKNNVGGVPPLLSVVMVHGPSAIAPPAGVVNDMPLISEDETDLPHELAASRGEIAPFPGPVAGKYQSFVEGVRNLAMAKDDEQLFYRCNFDDAEALVKSVIRIASAVIMRRQSEDLIPLKLRQGEDRPGKKGCCTVL